MKKNKNFKFFEKDIPFEPNYNIIKNKIEMQQYTNNETSTRRIQFRFVGSIIISILCVAVVLGIVYTFSGPKIKYLEQSNVKIYNHDKEFVDTFEHVFIGKVQEKVQTKQYDGTGMEIPYTFFKVEQIYILKGEKNVNNHLVCFFGGYKNSKKIELLKNNSEVIEIEQYYLFFVNSNKDDTSTRIGLNDYIISDNNQKILLEDYNENKEITNQNQKTLTIVNRYKNIIDRKLGNEILEIEEYNDKKEIYNTYTYVSIIRINNFVPTNTKGIGIYSEIVSAYYSTTVLMNFKKEVGETKKNLYCYGTNFWNNENEYAHFVDLLEDGSVYLLFANECLSNENNTRVNIGDLVAMENYQLVKLEDYQIEKSYEKQSDRIKEIINEYIG